MCAKGRQYTEIDYGFNAKTLDISAMSLHRVLATAMKLDAINEWGSVIALTYIAAQRGISRITMKWQTPRHCLKVYHAVSVITMH